MADSRSSSDVIDLTGSNDDSDESLPSADIFFSPRPRNTPVPLPKNVRDLVGKTPPTQKSAPSKHDRSNHRKSPAVNSDSEDKIWKRNSVVLDRLAQQGIQAEKRRKLHSAMRNSEGRPNFGRNISERLGKEEGNEAYSSFSESDAANEKTKRSSIRNGTRGSPLTVHQTTKSNKNVLTEGASGGDQDWASSDLADLEESTAGLQEIKSTIRTSNKGLEYFPPGSEIPDETERASLLEAFKPRAEPLQKPPKLSALNKTGEIGAASLSLMSMGGRKTLKRKADGILKENEISVARSKEYDDLTPNRTSSPDTAGLTVPAVSARLTRRSSRNKSTGSTQTPPELLAENGNDRTNSKVARYSLPYEPMAPTSSLDQSGGNPKGKKFSKEEDDRIIYMKEVLGWTWSEIGKNVPGRNTYTVQSRYSRALCNNSAIVSDVPLDLVHLTFLSENDSDDPNTMPNDTPGISTARPSSEDSIMSGISQPTYPDDSVVPSATPATENLQPKHLTLRRGRPPPALEGLRESNKSQPQLRNRSVRVRPAGEPQRTELERSIDSKRILPMDSQREVASIAISTSDPSFYPDTENKVPYLRFEERRSLHHGLANGEWSPHAVLKWQGTIVHVDFQEEEMEILESSIIRILSPSRLPTSRCLRKRIQRMLKNVSENRIYQIAWHGRKGRRLGTRDRESVEAFLKDAAAGLLNSHSHIERIGPVKPDRTPEQNAKMSTSTMLRQRELGIQARRGWATASNPLSTRIKNHMADTIGPAYSFTGTSSDVNTVAWSPNGRVFAAGSACLVDDDSMQYNRPNNLLLGDIENKTLLELPDHHIMRQKAPAGVNSSHSMHVSQDPRLFTTISMVDFSPDGGRMFSAGYDKIVRVWDTTSEETFCCGSLEHKAPVDLISVSPKGLLATGCRRSSKNAIKVLDFDYILNTEEERSGITSYTSQKAVERSDMKILPTCLRFEPIYGRLLLAGFGANSKEDWRDTNGEICLWDVQTQRQLTVHGNTRNVFDCAFDPHQVEAPLFAVGCVAGGNVNRGCRSIVRFYDWRAESKYGMIFELECPALDMNDVVYCPHNDVYFATGCTDGRTYIWDIRQPNNLLYTLSHGEPLQPLDEHEHREILDTGMRFCSWGDNATRLYTGSSDGVVKVWDITRSPEDVFIKDLVTLDSGVMSGAFSPDKTSLLVGEVNGSINVLQVGREDCTVKEMEPLRLISASTYSPESPTRSNSPASSSTLDLLVDPDSGVAIAAELVRSDQIEIVPFGGLPIRQATQGINYSGPYDSAEDAWLLRERALDSQRNLVDSPGEQCNLLACKDSILKLTCEEAGDSGRSTDRIPDELRKAWKKVGSDITVVAGKTKCTTCGRPARPSVGGGPQTITDREALCERCGFECFRCGNRAVVSSETDVLWCLSCNREWEVGALGYEALERRRGSKNGRAAKRAEWRRGSKESIEDATLGDEMNDLADYYHSLWIDRPPSPL